MKGFIEVYYGNENKLMLIAVSAIITVRTIRDSAYITLTETNKDGHSEELKVNHSYLDVLDKIQKAL